MSRANIPTKKSREAIAVYKLLGPQFGSVLHTLYNKICQGKLIDNIEHAFIDLCHQKFGSDIIFPFAKQVNLHGEEFGHAICISANNEVAHGRPTNGKYKTGDILSVDCGMAVPFKNKYLHFDAAFTTTVNNKHPDSWIHQPLAALRDIVQYSPNNVEELSNIIHNVAIKNWLGQVVSLTGHGIGYSLHEPPTIFNMPSEYAVGEFFEGICFCAEPIFTYSNHDSINHNHMPLITPIAFDDDEWTLITVDKSYSTHWETVFGIVDGQVTDFIGITQWDI
jgi:methionyl aminopeptidase